ncbi:MAG: carboxypeptidase-like regulatory domain-containing protein, partial [Planctomycetota bacterium]
MARLSVISKQFALVTSWLCSFACGRPPAIRRAAALILGLLVVAGCLPGGGQATPVPTGGVITFNGEVVAGAYVLFIPETGPQASATTDAEGGFELTTVKAKDGVVPGKCRIAIEKR